MTAINLLRWRENFSIRQLGGLPWHWIGLCILFILVSSLHVLLSRANHQMLVKITSLKNKFVQERVENEFNVDVPRAHIQSSQQKLRRLFSLLNCLGMSHVRVDKVSYQIDQVSVVGHVSSPAALVKALEICRARTHVGIDKTFFKPDKQANFLQFSLNIF